MRRVLECPWGSSAHSPTDAPLPCTRMAAGRRFPVSSGIPNLLLTEEEC